MSYAWLPTKKMMADCLTKEMKIPSSREVVIKGKGLILNVPFINEVKNINGELRIINIHNPKKVKLEEDDKSGQLHRRQESRRSNSR